MRLIFTRHGESEANLQRIISNRDLAHHLSEIGRLQAIALADRLATLEVAAIYASPILRAQQTASVVAEKVGLSIHTAAALCEFDCGVMEGRGDEEAWKAHDAVVEAWDKGDYFYRIPGGENFYDVRTRFVPFMEGLVEEYAQSDGDIVLISHGSMLHQMLPLVLSNIDRAFTQQHPLGNGACVLATPRGSQLVCLEWDSIQFVDDSR